MGARRRSYASVLKRQLRFSRRPKKAPIPWAGVERVSKVLAIVAMPVVLAIGGWHVQKQLQSEAVKRDYVQLSISILKERDPAAVKPEIRSWAVDMLQANSPSPLPDDLLLRLKSGQATLAAERITSRPSPCLTPAVEQRLNAALASLQAFLKTSGFDVDDGEVEYEAVPGSTVWDRGQRFIAVFDPEQNLMRVACSYIDDTDLVRHEYMRHVLLAALWTEPDSGQDKRWNDYYAVLSGLSLYFPCSQKKRPVFGRTDDIRLVLNTWSRIPPAITPKEQYPVGTRGRPPSGISEARLVRKLPIN